jgi:uncharacterized integral membrane protein
MKKVKIVIWIIIIGFLAIIFFSNKDYFLAKQSLQIKIPHIAAKSFKELPNVVYFLVFFVIGFLVAYFLSLSERFKSKKTIKNLNTAATSQLQEISDLKKEMDSLRGGVAGNNTSEPEPEAQNPASTA